MWECSRLLACPNIVKAMQFQLITASINAIKSCPIINPSKRQTIGILKVSMWESLKLRLGQDSRRLIKASEKVFIRVTILLKIIKDRLFAKRSDKTWPAEKKGSKPFTLKWKNFRISILSTAKIHNFHRQQIVIFFPFSCGQTSQLHSWLWPSLAASESS